MTTRRPLLAAHGNDGRAAPAYLGYTSSYYDPAPLGYGQVYSVGAPVVAASGLSFVDGAASGDLYGSTGLYGSGLGGGLGALYSSTGFGGASNDWGMVFGLLVRVLRCAETWVKERLANPRRLTRHSCVQIPHTGVGGSAVVMPSAGDFIAGGGGYGAGFGFY